MRYLIKKGMYSILIYLASSSDTSSRKIERYFDPSTANLLASVLELNAMSGSICKVS